MRKTTCAKADHKDLNELCAFDEQNVVNMKRNHICLLIRCRIFSRFYVPCFVCVYSCLQEFANCNSTVDVAPWRLEPAEANLQCEQGPLPIRVRSTTKHSNVEHHSCLMTF